jgi:hypothetical protein
MARQSVISTAILRDANQHAHGVSFTVDGQTIVVRPTDLNPMVLAEATWHGVKQKIGDAAALGAGSTGKDKLAAMRKVADQIMGTDGVWTARGEGDNGLFMRALAKWMGTEDVDAARKAFDGLEKDVQSALPKDPDMVKLMADIRVEDAKRRAKATPEAHKVATDALAKLKAMSGPTAAAKKAA